MDSVTPLKDSSILSSQTSLQDGALLASQELEPWTLEWVGHASSRTFAVLFSGANPFCGAIASNPFLL
jgi:hypothetical protein